jgi:general stress protein 26
MTAFREEETGTIWFFTRDDTDLAKDAAIPDQSAMFTYGSKDQDVWACIHGTLSVAPRNPALIDKHWNPILAAWYPGGKDDPHLTLLRFDADDGRIWVSKKGPVRFMFEIARASLTKTLPDAGGVADVNLQ